MTITIDMPGTFRLRAVFSTSVKAFGRHALVFIIVSAIAHIPGYLWSSWVAVHYAKARALLPLWAGLLFSIVDLACVVIAYGAIIYAVIEDLAGRRVSIAQAVAIASRRLLPLVGVLVATVVLSSLSGELVLRELLTDLIALDVVEVVNALVQVLVMVMYFVAAPVFIAEQAGIGTALSRCPLLTKGYRWRIFGVILLAGILECAVFVVAVVGTAALPFLHLDSRSLTPASDVEWIQVVMITEFHGILIVLGAFNTVIAAVFYDRLHVAKDGVHLAKVFD